jgi:phosphoserine phosphatase
MASEEELRHKRDELNAKTKDMLGQRKGLIAQVRQLREKFDAERAARDKENVKVAEAKAKRGALLDEVKKQRAEFEKILSLLNTMKDAVGGSYAALKQRFDELDWEYQTGVFSIKKEKEMVKEMDELERLLNRSEKLRDKQKDVRERQKKIRELYNESSIYHDLVLTHAKESEAKHKAMIDCRKKIDELSAKIKALDEDIKKNKAQADEAHGELLGERKKSEGESEKERRSEESQRREKEKDFEAKLRKKAEQALTNFKQGKKVTMEELALMERFELY